MRFLTQFSIAGLASLTAGYAFDFGPAAASHAFDLERRDRPLKVELTTTGNTEIDIALTNTGENPVNLLNTGTLLDINAPTEKVQIFLGSEFLNVIF